MKNLQFCNISYQQVDSAYLDCISDNLAALLHYYSIQDIRTPFGAQWYFDFVAGTLPVVHTISVEQRILDHTGYMVHTLSIPQGAYLQTCIEYVQQRQPVLLIGDAYFMPWLPYFGHEHQEHSFIVAGISDDQQLLYIVDAYTNKTEWGTAIPIATDLSAQALERIIDALDTPSNGQCKILQKHYEPPASDTTEILRTNANLLLQQIKERDRLRAFSHYYRERNADITELRAFVLGCWLVARARGLHALWLADRADQHRPFLADFAAAFTQDIVIPWQRVSEFAYVMLQRVLRGRAAPMSCFDLLEQQLYINEIRLATQLRGLVAG